MKTPNPTRPLSGLCLILSLALVGCGAPTETYDLVIANGRVMDPASGTDEVLNVGIRDGQIAALSEADLAGERVIDATGHVVAPGFIDLHEHGQTEEAYRVMVQDGVTSAFELEVGTDNVAGWYAERQGGQYVNYGVSVGHIPVRMGLFDDPGDFLPSGAAISETAGPEQIAEMARQLQEGLDEGAVAVGFGLAYTPAATMEEVEAMLRVAKANGASAHIHVKDGVPGVREAIAAAAHADAALHVVHANSTGGPDITEFLATIDSARAEGQDVTTEAYPYEAGMTSIQAAFLDDWASYPDEVFRDYQWVATGERLTRATFAKYREQGGTLIMHERTEDMTRTAIAHPIVMIASDGFIADGGGHPRTAGSYAKVLGKYVREEGVLTLMDALRKMTIDPVRRLEARVPALAKKGRLEAGADADIVLFDPATVIDRATYAEPTLPSQGIPYVIIGGVPVVDGGVLEEGVRPGQAIRADIK